MAKHTFQIEFAGIKASKSIDIQGEIQDGFWLNENNEELTQENGVNNNILFGQKVKVKLITSHPTDGEILKVEIKLKKEKNISS